MITLRDVWPSAAGLWRPADQRPAHPVLGDTWFGPDGNTVWYWVGRTAIQLDTSKITKELKMPEDVQPTERVKPDESQLSPADPRVHDSPFRDPDARYRSSIHTEHTRRIRIDADGLDAGIYVELLRMITDRWPKAKLAGGGIVVPEETDGADISISAPLPGTKAAATHQRPHESTHHAYPSYWQRSANEHLLTVLADASRLPLAAVAHSLAEHGQHSPDPHTAIAAFIRDHKLAKPAERKPHFDTKEYWTTGDHLTLTRALADVNNEPLEYTARTLAGLTGGNRGPYGALDVYIRDRGRKYEWNTAAAWGSTEMNQTVDALAKAADIPRSNVISALIRHGQVCTTPAETVAAFVTGTGLRRP